MERVLAMELLATIAQQRDLQEIGLQVGVLSKDGIQRNRGLDAYIKVTLAELLRTHIGVRGKGLILTPLLKILERSNVSTRSLAK